MSEEDANYGDEGDYIEGEYDEDAIQPIASIPKVIPETSHIASDEVLGIQTRFFVLSTEGSPSEMCRIPALCQSSLSQSVHSGLLRVVAINNRANPAPEHVEGQLDRIVMTGLRCRGFMNQTQQPVNGDMSKQVPMMISNTDKAFIMLEPTGGNFVPIDLDLFAPADLMSRDWLKIWERVDDTVLPSEFKTLESKKIGKQLHLIPEDGVAHTLLRKNPYKFGEGQIGKPVPQTNYVQIPEHVANALYTYMKNTIETIKGSFTSVNDINMTWRPARGRWDDVQTFVGETANIPMNKKHEYNERITSRKNRISVLLEAKYMTIDKINGEKEK